MPIPSILPFLTLIVKNFIHIRWLIKDETTFKTHFYDYKQLQTRLPEDPVFSIRYLLGQLKN